jgi:hypothetical protein
MGAVIFAPLKLPTCPKQGVDSPVAFTATPCSVQQVLSTSCSSISYWLQEEFHLSSSVIAQSLVGLLSFLLILTKYTSPLDEIYRPPMIS